jgi:hypothetical protein
MKIILFKKIECILTENLEDQLQLSTAQQIAFEGLKQVLFKRCLFIAWVSSGKQKFILS